MDRASRPVSFQDVQKLARRCQFYLLRWETEFTPCTGITAVTRQERRFFGHQGMMIAPWQSRMPAARAALDQGRVVDIETPFRIAGPCAHGARVQVLMTPPGEVMPIVYLAVEGAFQGLPTPYDTPGLARDTLVFGAAVAEFLSKVGATGRQFVWGADWQMVPALTRLRTRHLTVLTLHNEFDAWLAREASEFGGGLYPLFHGQETALRIGLKLADVATTVNRGYARGLRTEPIHTQVMAHHLQDLVWRIVPVENANFLSLSPEHKELEALLARDPSSGLKVIEDTQRQARAALPEVMRVRIGDRVLIVAMGRLAAQKLHDVISEGVRILLRQHRDLPLFVAFPIVSGESGDRSRLERIHYLVHEFPDRVCCTEGRIEYFDTLMRAADYNAMTSLYEPHGGAFEGSVVPIVRLIDGLARQVNALEPTGRGVPLNAIWHDSWELPSGLGFREPTTLTEVDDLRALLTGSFAPENLTFRAMVSAFAEVLATAVSIRRDRPEVYARLVQGALRAQMERDWLTQLGGILALVEEARLRRPL
ncbi:MAG: glycogen/starch synthase [Isosphaeraceae bacterium]